MSKTKTARAAKPQKSRAKKSGPPKLSAEQISDAEAQRLLLHHQRKLTPLLLAEKAAKDAVRKQYELAKKEGVTKKELGYAFKFDTEEGEQKLTSETETLMRVARWKGSEMGEQLNLFEKQSASTKAYEDGKRAGLDNQPRRPPMHLSDAASKQWIAGHEAGTAHVNKARDDSLSGFKKLGETVPDLVPPTPESAETRAAH